MRVSGKFQRSLRSGRLERRYLRFVLERQCDVVQAIEQAMPAERFDLERVAQARVIDDGAAFQVGRESIAFAGLAAAEQLVDLPFIKPHGQQAVLEAVAVEDVGEARREDCAKAIILQGPGRMLATRSAAKIAPRQKNRSALIARAIELEIRIERAVVVLPPIEEQKLAKAGPFDPLEELLGNDLVRVDVGAIHRRDQAGVIGEGFHL